MTIVQGLYRVVYRLPGLGYAEELVWADGLVEALLDVHDRRPDAHLLGAVTCFDEDGSPVHEDPKDLTDEGVSF